ncbi:non-ribosomal peptide synthetase [Streptomyces sp. S465]|uniref:non-ribosomal peptide synthetase n=1 Tax=Streptomyces sp. S465 TaxID=2979468 RepID=UPI0022A8B35E|nr:non-ribosomal peptide synthetase [Streptomyces sp. S465]WAP54906.1 non-ribosomal peptide synthetase [Streptomyces sp. S465]
MSKPVLTGTPAVPQLSRAQQALERWASEHPDRAGVIGIDGRGLTWAEVSASTRTLAGRLERAGAGAGHRVAVMAGRSRYALSSLLAIWANGSSAVLLDEWHPVERLRWVVRDAGCSVVVSSEPVAADLGLTVVDTDGTETAPAGLPPAGRGPAAWASQEPGAEAYVVYTSGTTGHPKGVRVGVAALENFLANAASLGYRPGSRAVSVVSPGFDGWLWSVLTPFVNGVTCVALDTALENLEQGLAGQQIDNLCMTPSLYAAIEKLPQVEVAVVAGESCPDSLVVRLGTIAERVINVYGPTETTIAATMADTARGEDPRTIGRPMSGCTVTVVDADLNEVPPGVTGEVLIGGLGVALGYVSASGPTADRFIERNGARYFRTGDLGTLRADGQLSFLGRGDNQVKIGGFRVELEEVERIACQVPEVKGAVAYVRGDPGTLAIGVQTAAGAPLDDPLRSRLASAFAARLPRQLCPAFTHRIAEIPLEPTGKVARREVAALGEAVLPGDRDQVAAAGAPSVSDGGVLEGVLAAFSGVFGHSVAEDCDFFALGGHSLLAAQLASRMEAQLGVAVSITDILTARTPRAVADRIDETGPE